MRNVMMAILVLTPSLIHAQATTPATTRSTSVLVSSLNAPAVPSAKPAAAAAAPYRVSTGVVAPTLLSSTSLASDGNLHPHVAALETKVVFDLIVDANGNPSDVKVAQSGGTVLDQTLLDAVSKYHYKPGTLDGQPIALPVKLTIVLERGAQY